jgi:hypothetical protein
MPGPEPPPGLRECKARQAVASRSGAGTVVAAPGTAAGDRVSADRSARAGDTAHKECAPSPPAARDPARRRRARAQRQAEVIG